MFCTKCGKPIQPGDRFCLNCGTPVPADAQAPEAAAAAIPPPADKKRNFFSTPGGIVLVIVIALLVVGGAVVGAVLLTRGGDGASAFQKETSELWADFSGEVDEIDGELSDVSDLTEVTSADTIEDFRGELENHREAVEGYLDSFESIEAPQGSRAAYGEFMDSLELYVDYLKELDRFYGIYVADPLDDRLDGILTGLEETAGKIESGVEEFLDSNPLITETSFEPAILEVPGEYEKQLEQIRGALEDQQQDQSSDQALAPARAAMDNILNTYLSGGWDSLGTLMTQQCYDRHRYDVPPPDQGDFDVTGVQVVEGTMTDANTAVFTVLQSIRTWDGEEFQDYMLWELIKSGDSWLLNSVEYIQ